MATRRSWWRRARAATSTHPCRSVLSIAPSNATRPPPCRVRRKFRTDIESFVTIEAVRGCIEAGVRERQPQRQYRYVGFVDPSGGSADAMTLAIAHKEGTTAILDLVREVRPPFSPRLWRRSLPRR